MYFCKKCQNFSPENICGFCGAKKLREARENDPVYLATKTTVYAGMLEEALKQNDIPFIKREKHGGILKFMGAYGVVGLGIEEFRFYVPFGAQERAKEILDTLFTKHISRAAITSRFKQGIKRKKSTV